MLRAHVFSEVILSCETSFGELDKEDLDKAGLNKYQLGLKPNQKN